MDLKKLNAKLVQEIKSFFKQANKKKAVIGLSGGIDSALTLDLLVQALGNKNVTGLIMPLKGTSSKESIIDAKKLTKRLKVKAIEQPINEFVKPFTKTNWKQTKTAKTNLYPRLRAVLLYNYANSNNALVVGTGNKTELTLGYFTKYGDGAVDFLPIGGLYKTQVQALAAFRKLPKEILQKTPSAELWVGQTDEKELGLTYRELDLVLFGLESGKTLKDLEKKGIKSSKISLILKRMAINKHKTQTPPQAQTQINFYIT